MFDADLRAPFYDAEMIQESVRLATVLKLSEDELMEVCSACGMSTTAEPDMVLRGLLKLGSLDMAVMTRGFAGAVLLTADGVFVLAGIPTTVIFAVCQATGICGRFANSQRRRVPTQEQFPN